MSSSKPPVLATWLLEHLVLGDRNEALAGDLLEEFQRRHSVTWYWHQVLGAILISISNEFRAEWVMVWTIVFPVVWTYCLYLFVMVGRLAPLARSIARWGMTHHTLYGHAIAIVFGILLFVAMPLSIYLAFARNLRLRAFTCGLCAGTLVIFMMPVVHPQETMLLKVLIVHIRAKHWNLVLWLTWYAVLKACVPLLAAMWAAQSCKKGTRAAPLPGQSTYQST